jgi:hypothetical protein
VRLVAPMLERDELVEMTAGFGVESRLSATT